MKRVMIIGSPGSGKSTFAVWLSKETELPLIHLDKLFWRPGWVHCSREEFDGLLQTELEKNRWIIDGNYSRTVEARLKYADTVVFFRYPRTLCLWRVIKRWLQSRGKVRSDMGEGCPERLDFEFLKYVWNFNKTELPQTLEKLKGNHGAEVIEIKNRKNLRALKGDLEMSEILNIIEEFRRGCDCGRKHDTAICDIQIGSGLVNSVGEILKKNNFPKKLLLVADKNTLKAAEGIEKSLEGFEIEYKIYDNIRVAEMSHVVELEELVKGKDIGILSVGTGSVNDPCRLAAARQDKMLCIFATAPSMDGFASYGAPIVDKGFKLSYDAKSPEVIIGDTKILAEAPVELKAAGFGDMIAKYVGLVDWQISTLLTGEYYCDKIAALTREAVDELMGMADKVTVNDETTAGKIFEALLKTGIGMSFAQNSRPASGCEHVICHLMECIELRDGIIPNYHGDDIGVATLEMLKFYNELANHKEIEAWKENADWEDIFAFYGEMSEDVKKLNFPTNVVDDVDIHDFEAKWGKIVKIIRSVPSYEECYEAMKKAGCRLTVEDIGKDRKLFDDCIKYSPYMRRRLTLLRLQSMFKVN